MGNCYTSTEHQQYTADIATRKSTTKKKGAGIPQDYSDSFINADEERGIEFALWEHPLLDDDGVVDEDDFLSDDISLDRKGETYELFKPEVLAKLRKYLSTLAKDTHKSLDGFRFRKSDIDALNIDEDELEAQDVTKCAGKSHYLGQWKHNENKASKREGRGIAIYSDGSIYEGFWKNDMRNGVGRLIYKNGDVYQGQWNQNKSKGYGIFAGYSGYKVKGYFENNKINGEGFEINKKGDEYRGLFEDGFKNGQGTLKSYKRTVYTGDFKNDLPHGKGTCEDPKIGTFEGIYFKGKKHGKGIFRYSNGDVYEGDFKNDMKEGEGTYTYADGTYYKGGWKDDVQHGKAEVKTQKGKVVKCEFRDGEAVNKISK